jgi:hypothetical protein
MSAKPAAAFSSAIMNIRAISDSLTTQSGYALHILNNPHDYGPIDRKMSVLKPLKHTSLLTPYERLFKHSFQKAGSLISEKFPRDPNPLLKVAVESSLPHLPFTRPD